MAGQPLRRHCRGKDWDEKYNRRSAPAENKSKVCRRGESRQQDDGTTPLPAPEYALLTPDRKQRDRQAALHSVAGRGILPPCSARREALVNGSEQYVRQILCSDGSARPYQCTFHHPHLDR